MLASSWTFRSGAPRSPSVGSDVNGAFLARNSYVGPDYKTIDLRLSKRVRTGGRTSVLVIAEAFNLLNRVNYTSVNMTWGTDLAARSTCGQFTEANNARELQFGVKFEF